MSIPNLGKLERIDVREAWQNEATAFTPWLAKETNLGLLADTLGLELEATGQEEAVGPYRADIVCRNLADDSLVLIENQLERTDHTHLGQLMTYAAGLDAVTIVWIARRFTDEHRAALDWLNDITAENIAFFGLEIELWRIGNSDIAPKFNLTCEPNEWTKSQAGLSSSSSEGGVSDTKRLQQDFWAGFKAYLKERNSPLKPQKASPKHWLTIAIGRSHFNMSALVNTQDNRIGAGLNLKGQLAKQHFDELYADRETIESESGISYDWRRLPGKESSRIQVYKQDCDIKDKAEWQNQFEWLAETLEAMNHSFRMRIKALPDEYPELDDPTSDENE